MRGEIEYYSLEDVWEKYGRRVPRRVSGTSHCPFRIAWSSLRNGEAAAFSKSSHQGMRIVRF